MDERTMGEEKIEEYRSLIFEMVNKVDSEPVLRYIYIVVSDIEKELDVKWKKSGAICTACFKIIN